MPPIYATCLRRKRRGQKRQREPMGMHQRVSHHAARASLGDSRVSLNKAIGGDLARRNVLRRKAAARASLGDSRVSLNKAIGGDLARRNVLWRKAAPVYDRGVLWLWDLASWNSRL